MRDTNLSTFFILLLLIKCCLIEVLKYVFIVLIFYKIIEMDNYIYYRVLDWLSKHEKATKSELVISGGLNWVKNPVTFLYENGFLEKTTGDYQGATYLKLTDKGRNLYQKMKIFYETYDDALTIVNTKLRIRECKT